MIHETRIKKAIAPKTSYTSSGITQAEKEKWLEESIKERELWNYNLQDKVFLRTTGSFGTIVEFNLTDTAQAIAYGERLDVVKIRVEGNPQYGNYTSTPYATWYSVFEIYKADKDGKPIHNKDTRGNDVIKPINNNYNNNNHKAFEYDDESGTWHHGLGL